MATDLANTLALFLNIFGRWRERDALRQNLAAAWSTSVETGTASELRDLGALTRAIYLQEIGLGEDDLHRGNLRAATVRFTRLLARIEAQPTGTPLSSGCYEHSVTLTMLARCLQDGRQAAAAEGHLRRAIVI